jgi:hypothetical protein
MYNPCNSIAVLIPQTHAKSKWLEGVRVNVYMYIHTIYIYIYLQYMHMCVQYLSMYTVYVYSMSVRAYVLELSHCGGFNIQRHIQKVGCCKLQIPPFLINMILEDPLHLNNMIQYQENHRIISLE